MPRHRNLLVVLLSAAYLCAALSAILNLFPRLFEVATPVFLCIVSIICLTEYQWNLTFSIWFALTFTGLIAIEILGVRTAFPFGEYHYTSLMGPRFMSVPIIIGLNWVIIILGATQTVEFFAMRWNRWVKSLSLGMICMIFDIILERAVLKLGYWEWRSGIIPIRNYIAWFILSFLFSFLLIKGVRRQYNESLARINLLYQAVFFTLIIAFKS